MVSRQGKYVIQYVDFTHSVYVSSLWRNETLFVDKKSLKLVWFGLNC